jgi:outer membrane beta-barrel protein
MHPTLTFIALLTAVFTSAAIAQPAPVEPRTANEQVIVPQVDRRDVKLPKFPSNDFEANLFAGTYATENFGSNTVSGLRLGYHITEDIFVQATYGKTKVSDEAFRQILPGGIFINKTETLSYYNLSAGYNVMPGEVFFGRNTAKASQAYIVGGVGSTTFNKQKKQTFNVGFGMRLYLSDYFTVQADVRDHIFTLDLLGKRQSTQNLEITTGVSFIF